MIRQQNKIFTFFLYICDSVATLLAFFCAYWIRGILPQVSYAKLFPFSGYLNLLFAIFPTWFIIFYIIGLYRFWRGQRFWKEIWDVFKAVFIASLILGFTVFVLKYQFVSRLLILLFSFIDFFFIIVGRIVIRKIFLFFSKKTERFRKILIIGLKKRVIALAEKIEKNKDMGLQILGFLSTHDDGVSRHWKGYPILGRAENLPKLLDKEVVDEVIFAISQEELQDMGDLFLLCEERGITARLAINFFPHLIAKTHLEELDGIPLLTFAATPKNELLLLLRRVFDLLGSFILILILSPVLLLIILLIRLDSHGPAIYRQIRCGLNGRKFIFYKFRSMIQGAEAKRGKLAAFNVMNGPVFKMKNDPRVTRIGRLLRRTSFDELPQLFNILRGDMSFVGARPPLPEEVEQYQGWQRRRLSMKPGLTGLWQVSGRNQIDFDQWMKLDLEYIDNWSLWLDFKILLKTIPAIIFGRGAM